MMDIDTFTQLVNGVGFPIVASAALFWLNVNVMKQQKETLATLQAELNKHTGAIQELATEVKRNV